MKAKLNFFCLLFLLVLGLSFLFPVYAQMGPGSAISFDGTDDVVLTSNPIITGTGAFTITAWIKRGATGRVDFIAGNYGIGNPGGIEFGVQNTNRLFCYIGGYVDGTTTLNANEWYYVAVTRESSGTTKLYVNGILDGINSLGGSITGALNFAIGDNPDHVYPFMGRIDEVRVYSSALTQDQIRLNEHLRLSMPFPGNLQAYWRFDEGSGTNAWESVVGATYNGVLTNGPAWVTSTAPFGTGTSAKLTVSAGGSTYDASVQYTAYNATGSPVDFYVTLLTSSPASPPSVIRTYNKYWIFETYGVATGDANRIFSLPNGSISPADLSAPGNIIVYYRDGTSDAAFLSAGATSTTQNTVTDHGTATSRQLLLGTNSSSPLTGPPHFSASDMNFGNVCVGFSHSIDLVITNDGTGWMYVSGVSANPSGFTYSTSTFNIAPGATHNVTVTFSPSLVQLYSGGSITFTYNGSTFVVNLQGRGIGAPTLSTPINGLTGVSILPTCTWGAVTGAASYKLYLDDDPAYVSPNYNSNVGSVTSKTFLATDPNFPLINSTLYYWKVATVDDYGNELPSGSFHFTTVPDAGISLSMPTDASIVYTTSVIFSWWVGGSSSGLRYVLQYAQQGSAPSETQWAAAPSSITTNTYKTISGLLAGKKYYWRVIAQWNSGSHEVVCYSSVFSFNIQGGATVVPIPSWPIEDAIVYTNSPTLSWYLGEYASGLTYQVDYVQDNGGSPGYTNAGGPNNYFTDYLSSENHISTGSGNLYYTIGPLAPGTKYWWKVRSYYAASGDYSAWSVVQSFRTNGTGTLTVPVPSYPTGAVTIYTTAPTFYWYLNTYATGLYYDVDLSTDHDFGSHVAGYPHTTAVADQLYYNVSGLTPGQTYYWRVRSNNLTNQSAWSESTPITNATFNVVGGSTNSYPILTYPILNTIVYTPTPTLSWYLEGSSLGLTGYKIKWKASPAPSAWDDGTYNPLSNDVNGGQASVSPISTTYYTIPVSLAYGVHYYWAVRTNGATPSAYSQGDFTVVGGSTVGSPILFLPINGSTIYSTTVNLFWYMNGSTTGIDYYNIQYSNSDTFASPVSTTSTTQSLAVSGLTSGATYYWKVQAHYTSGSPSAWSAVWSFTIQVGSPKVVQPLVGGPNDVQINTSYATLSWFTPMQAPSAMKYDVDYADNPDFSNAKQVSDIAATHIQVSELNSNTQYYWRVKSKADDGTYSNYSNTGSFKVGDKATAVGNESVIPKEFSVSQNYPNPFNPITVINYALPKSALVSIKIYNMLGQEVKTLVNSEKSAGTYSVQWGGDNNYGQQVSSGTYIYRVIAGEYSRTLKMILVK